MTSPGRAPRVSPLPTRQRRGGRPPTRLATAVVVGLASLAATPTPAPCDAQAPPAEQLVDANFTAKVDRLGYSWDINSYGAIGNGTANAFNTALVLNINGQQFYAARGQMTADGSEIVLHRSINGVDAVRRVWVDARRGAARFIEVLTNEQGSDMNVTVALHSTLGYPCQHVVTTNGKAFTGGQLPRGDVGVAAIQSVGSRPSVVFLLSGATAKLRPTVNVRNNQVLEFTYNVPLKAHETVALVHLVVQRRDLTAVNVTKEVRPFYGVRLNQPNVPPYANAWVANFQLTGGATAQAPLMRAVTRLADLAGVERGAADVLVLDDTARLAGAVTCRALTIQTGHGKAQVALDEVALLMGGAGAGRPMRLHLRSGEVLLGEVKAEALAIKTAAGLQVPLDPAAIDRLFMRADKAADGRAAPEASAILELHDGSRLAVADAPGVSLHAVTAWGAIDVPLADVIRFWPVREPTPGYRVALADGSRLAIVLTDQSLNLPTLRFGPLSLEAHDIRRIIAVNRPEAETGANAKPVVNEGDDAAPAGAAYCRLAGDNLIMGTLDLAEMAIVTATGVTRLPAGQIDSLQRDDEGDDSGVSPRFAFKLREGGRLIGRFADDVVPVRWGPRVWRVPVAHLVAAKLPTPAPTPVQPQAGAAVE
jgi:hypothetical protein